MPLRTLRNAPGSTKYGEFGGREEQNLSTGRENAFVIVTSMVSSASMAPACALQRGLRTAAPRNRPMGSYSVDDLSAESRFEHVFVSDCSLAIRYGRSQI